MVESMYGLHRQFTAHDAGKSFGQALRAEVTWGELNRRLQVSLTGHRYLYDLHRAVGYQDDGTATSALLVANHGSHLDTLVVEHQIFSTFGTDIDRIVLISHRFNRNFYDEFLTDSQKKTYATEIAEFQKDPDNQRLFESFEQFSAIAAARRISLVCVPQGGNIGNGPFGMRNLRISEEIFTNLSYHMNQKPTLLLLYPEGTRSDDGVLRRAYKGSDYLIGRKLGIQHRVMGIAIQNTHRIYPRDRSTSRHLDFSVPVYVHLSPSHGVGDLIMSRSSPIDEIMTQIARNLPLENRGAYREVSLSHAKIAANRRQFA